MLVERHHCISRRAVQRGRGIEFVSELQVDCHHLGIVDGNASASMGADDRVRGNRGSFNGCVAAFRGTSFSSLGQSMHATRVMLMVLLTSSL